VPTATPARDAGGRCHPVSVSAATKPEL